MTAMPHATILDLIEHMRACAVARSRQVAGVLDAYLHTLPPPARGPALEKITEIWAEHYRLWAARIDTATALEIERRLCSFDWSETEAALRTLARDLEKGQKDAG
jgi:hypothetical protein